MNLQAKDVMEEVFSVSPDMPVKELANLLLEKRVDGACVVEEGELVGVVTTMDLLFQEKKLHLPTVLVLLDMFIPIQAGETEKSLRKMVGSEVRDIMTPRPTTVTLATSLEDLATLLVEKHFSLLPVLEEGKLQGVVTKHGLLKGGFFAKPSISAT